MKVIPRSWAFATPWARTCPGFAGDQCAGAIVRDRSHPRLVPDQAGAHNGVALGRGQEGIAQADQTAGRDCELEPDTAASIVDHVEHPRSPRANQVHDHADRILDGFDHQVFDRFDGIALDLFGDDFRPRDLEFVPFAAHGFDQDREMQFAPARDGEDVRLLGWLDPQREIRLQFAVKPLAELTGGRVGCLPCPRTARC